MMMQYQSTKQPKHVNLGMQEIWNAWVYRNLEQIGQWQRMVVLAVVNKSSGAGGWCWQWLPQRMLLAYNVKKVKSEKVNRRTLCEDNRHYVKKVKCEPGGTTKQYRQG